MKTIGLIVNPVAGVGGPAGMKGSDRAQCLARARELGIAPVAPARAAAMLRHLKAACNVPFRLLAAPGQMGVDEAAASGFCPVAIGGIGAGTTAADTKRIATEMRAAGADLVLFAGGDGTARDVCEAIGTSLPVLGIPSGVKMHSAVFAVHPAAAAHLVTLFLTSGAPPRLQEVMDLDEDAYVRGQVGAKLYGYLNVPYARGFVQGMKSGGSLSGGDALAGIAAEVCARMAEAPDAVFCIGAGTTTQAVKNALGIGGALLGVDVVCGGRLVLKDADSRALERLAAGRQVQVVVSPIGGQGFVLGRGNQQLSPVVLRRAGRAGLWIACTSEKLAALAGAPLLVDTGCDDTDRMFYGYHRIITGPWAETVYRIAATAE